MQDFNCSLEINLNKFKIGKLLFSNLNCNHNEYGIIIFFNTVIILAAHHAHTNHNTTLTNISYFFRLGPTGIRFLL